MGFVEIDPYCQELLGRRFPGLPIFGDIRKFDPAQIPGKIDLIHGGFPCQDISTAGRGVGIEGERSSLWAEFARCICLARPQYAVVENVPALTYRGMGVVLGTLAFGGYDAEWDCISAASVGAVHRRDREWIVATLPDANGTGLWHEPDPYIRGEVSAGAPGDGSAGDVADAHGIECQERRLYVRQGRALQANDDAGWGGQDVSDADIGGQSGHEEAWERVLNPQWVRKEIPNAENKGNVRGNGKLPGIGILEGAKQDNRLGMFRDAVGEWWATEPDVGRVANGVAARVDRLRCCGNSNPPQIVQYLGQLILEDSRKRGGMR